jgi:hypothetical protein
VVSVEEVGEVVGIGGGGEEGKEKKGKVEEKRIEKNWGRERNVNQQRAK